MTTGTGAADNGVVRKLFDRGGVDCLALVNVSERTQYGGELRIVAAVG